MKNTRLIGTTAENTFLCLLNQKDIFAQGFDTDSFDGVVFDTENKYFKIGKPPFYVQIKCRGSKTDNPNPQGFSKKTIDKIKKQAKELNIDLKSVYFVVGFYTNQNIRTVKYYIIPIIYLKEFCMRTYRVSVKKIEEKMENNRLIIKI